MSDEEKVREEEVFKQELSPSELDAASGGNLFFNDADDDPEHCVKTMKRRLYNGDGSMNCAATVEDGSRCLSNDACKHDAIEYQGMVNCNRAWQ